MNVIPLSVKKRCLEMFAEGTTSREIYNQYFVPLKRQRLYCPKSLVAPVLRGKVVVLTVQSGRSMKKL